MFKKVDNSLDFRQRELEVLDFWRENETFKQSVDLHQDGPEFTFYDGPPTANGKPHIGHILTRAVKDLIPRFRTMKGYNVLRKAGWDTHGLPVELEVEKLLGINGKDQIEAYGIEDFIDQCKKSVWKYKTEWEEMSERVGFWADMEDPYITYENNYIESEWWALKQIWDKDLLYQGHKIVPYCPRCGTALSSHEVAQGYKDVTEKSVYVRFKVKDQEDTYFAAWTTTPWTLPSNTGLCVNPEHKYVLVEIDERLVSKPADVCPDCSDHADEGQKTEYASSGKKVRYYIAEALAEKVLGEEFTVIETLQGKDLEYMAYEPLFPYADEAIKASKRKAHYVTLADFVSLSDGTGIVHLAPAFGEDDAQVGRQYSLPFIQLVQEDGTMPDEVTVAAGVFCKDADKILVDQLVENRSLLNETYYTHSYPFCWRCDTPLIYYARHSWFIAMTQVRDRLLANNDKINWIPKTIGQGRFGNFLENVVDWGLSRERYWGTPLPIWQCECGHEHLIGSIEELKEMSPDCPEDIELHRPYIDQVHLTCPECGKEMTRVTEVIDCWFDSGSMPFAQWHYPFENKEKFEATFPAQFISEAVDQTRGWFYTLLAISSLIFDEPCFENCIVLGHVCDKEGVKMSKHKGNVVDPWDVLNSEGADAVRWYFYANSQPWLPTRFSAEAVNEGKRKFMGSFWNSYAFYILYANIDKFRTGDYSLQVDKLTVLDKWILSRLNSLIKAVDHSLSTYDIHSCTKLMQSFVDDLSNWYVRRGRDRYWAPGMEEDKVNAYLTLYTVLKNLALVTAPFLPFMAEEIYQNLVRNSEDNVPESVHLADFPTADESLIDLELEDQMRLALDIVVLARSARNSSGVKTRQPLAKLYVASDEELAPSYRQLVAEELNVKEFVPVEDSAGLQDYSFKPQLRLLGKRFGKNLPLLQKALAELDGRQAMASLQEKAYLEVEVAGKCEKLVEEELLIESKELSGLASASAGDLTVALDLNLTEELVEEGTIRELVSKTQTMRKESGYEVTDRIKLYYAGDSEIEAVVERNKSALMKEVLAVDISPLTDCENRKDWQINGEKVTLAMERV